MNIVFMGTPDFASVILEQLMKAGYPVSCVVTQPDKAKDRGKKIQFTPVKEKALVYGLPVLQPEKIKGNEDFLSRMRLLRPDLIVVAAYGQILPVSLLELPAFGCVNVHASLLPKLRGASPIQHAILSGERMTGVTIMQMGEGLDTGDMLAKREVEIGLKNAGQLHDALAQAGAELLIEILPKIEKRSLQPKAQDEREASYAGLIRKEDGRIDFSKTPEEIERMIRAFDPWPGAFCNYKGKMMKLWAAQPLSESSQSAYGTIISATNEGVKISFKNGVLLVTEIQMPGKKRVKAADYLRGNSIEPGIILK